MITKIWKDLFHSAEVEGLFLANREDVEQIIDMLITYKIDPQIFFSNLEALLRGGMPSFNDFSRTEEKHKTTKSISYFTSVVNRPMGTSLWFLAGYPDVMHWFNVQREKYIKSHNLDYDGWEIETAKLFGFDIENETIDENQIMNSEGELRPKCYKNLIKHYKEITKKKLEVSVDENSENDIYLGAEFLDMIGSENIFTLIAENTTKYYLELSKNYKARFSDKVSLLATAGILDAQFYVFMDQSISPSEIIYLAKEAASSNNEVLINFIIKLEVKLRSIDIPDIEISEIENACFEQKDTILKTIEKTKEKYDSEPRITSDIKRFMKSAEFKLYRKILGIKKNFLFF